MTNIEAGERLQQIRRDSGLSQEAFAETLGVTRQAVSKWESGQSLPDIDNILLICDRFNSSADYILRGVTPPPAPEKAEAPPSVRFWGPPVWAAVFLLAGVVIFTLLPFLARRLQISDMELFDSFYTYPSAYIFKFPLAGLLLLGILFVLAGAIIGGRALYRRSRRRDEP